MVKRWWAVVLLGFVLLAGCREAEVGFIPPPTRPPTARPTPSPTMSSPAEIPRIQAQELWERLQAGESIVVVDVRGRNEYEQEHIVGALSLPLEELARRAAELPRDRLIVFYCT
ncbi:MAG: rhodanese-like domain-containing protein [Chloroflexia bacterium]